MGRHLTWVQVHKGKLRSDWHCVYTWVSAFEGWLKAKFNCQHRDFTLLKAGGKSVMLVCNLNPYLVRKITLFGYLTQLCKFITILLKSGKGASIVD